MSIKHSFSSGKADDADATLVNPSDWNAAHDPALTAKGDLIARSATAAAKLVIGADKTILMALAVETLGVKWAARAGVAQLADIADAEAAGSNETIPFGDHVHKHPAGLGAALHHALVTVSGTPNYVTLSGQDLVRGLIDLVTDVTGLLPSANIAADIARDSELHASAHTLASHSTKPHSALSDAPADAHHFAPKAIRKIAAQTVNNSSTLVDDTHLQFAIAANEVWAVEMEISVTEFNSVPDLKVAIALPAGASLLFRCEMYDASAGNFRDGNVTTTPGASVNLQSSEDTDKWVRLKALARNGGTAGDFKLRWAQIVANASNLTFAVDSFLVANRVA